ncbi:hypothetical protein FGO68_gene12412 [Halteria grandinella]|uniref:Uncharacterized protein n=1 Tax=Halteria grandinella TaxID=5974 RepID=A0A8J8SUV8_HALGN|nr:hypothetical protein FGO68_gene12412 [Halteria grandinella]
MVIPDRNSRIRRIRHSDAFQWPETYRCDWKIFGVKSMGTFHACSAPGLHSRRMTSLETMGTFPPAVGVGQHAKSNI